MQWLNDHIYHPCHPIYYICCMYQIMCCLFILWQEMLISLHLLPIYPWACWLLLNHVTRQHINLSIVFYIAVVCIPQGNTTCPPDNTNGTSGSWILEESELIFTEGDVYKSISARLDSQTAQYVGVLVLTCCAAPDMNTNPRFTNTTAALLMMSNVRGYQPVNWTEAGGRYRWKNRL